MTGQTWRYKHADLGEPSLPNGVPVLRPAVTVCGRLIPQSLIAVVDSGSPISVADSRLFPKLGVDIDQTTPLYSVPLGIAGTSGSVPVFAIELGLMSPHDNPGQPIWWHLEIGAIANWRLPFHILLGQHGWFDTFTTKIDGGTTSVQISKKHQMRPV